MVYRWLRGLVSILLMSVYGMNNAIAAVVPHLNQAQVMVASQSTAALPNALHQAMSDVLVKLSGNTDITTLSDIQASLAEAKDLVTQYRYDHNRLDRNKPWMLTATFNEDALKHILTHAGQNIWQSDRPSLLLWVTMDDHGTSSILSTSDQDISEWMQYRVFNDGLTVLFPEMDLTDQSVAKLPGHDFMSRDQAKRLLQRYGVDGLVEGVVSQSTGGQWHGQWKLLVDSQPFIWEDDQASLSALWQSLTAELVTLISNQSDVAPTSQVAQSVRLDIANVNDLDDYSQVMSVLRGVSSVSHLQVKNMEGTHLLLEVTLTGGAHAFAQAMRQHKLYAVSSTSSGTSEKADWFFSLGKPVAAVSSALPSAVDKESLPLLSAATYPLINDDSDLSSQEMQ